MVEVCEKVTITRPNSNHDHSDSGVKKDSLFSSCSGKRSDSNDSVDSNDNMFSSLNRFFSHSNHNIKVNGPL